MEDDDDYRLYAVDLDGILCDDIAPGEYQADLEACLDKRDQLFLSSTAPILVAGKHVVVTGRPTCDAKRTRTWLDRSGLIGIDAHFRETEIHTDAPESVAHHKGQTASRMGCSDFVESCPHQALLIATHYPHLRVHWWRGGQPVLVSAASRVQSSL